MLIWFSYFCPGICRFPRFPYIILNIPYNFLSGITTRMIQRNPTHLSSEYFTQDVRLVSWVVMKKKITPRNDPGSISGIMSISSYGTHIHNYHNQNQIQVFKRIGNQNQIKIKSRNDYPTYVKFYLEPKPVWADTYPIQYHTIWWNMGQLPKQYHAISSIDPLT